MSKVTLLCDNQRFEVDKKVACMSNLIKNMIEDLGGDSAEIPLSDMRASTLQKILEYCEHHKDDPIPEPEVNPDAIDDLEPSDRIKRSTDITEWDYNFINVEQPLLFEIMLKANFLDIKPLLDLTCKTVANMIKGKNPDELRATFNIKNDFTPEQLEEIRRENEWEADPTP